MTIKPTYTPEEFNMVDDAGKRLLMIKDRNSQISYVEGIIVKLSSFKPPLSKKNKHDELLLQLTSYLNLQQRKLQIVTENRENEVAEFQDELEAQKQKMDSFSRQFLLEES